MSITVREVLTMKEWKNCRILAGEEGLDREILYIDSMEVPDIIPWLKKDELLITTAYSIKENEEKLLDIIRALEKNGSAGIALKTKFFGSIPEKIKQVADELKVPVIEIPGDMPFIDLANPLMKKIVNVQNRKLEFNKEMNEKFLAVQIEGGSFEEIARILGELLKCKIVVTDQRQKLICYYPEEWENKEEWIALESEIDKNVSEQCNQSAYMPKEGIMVTKKGKKEVWKQAILVKTQCNGYLYAIGEGGRFNEMSEIAIRQAAVYLALEFSKQGLREQKEYYQDNNFFQDLIGGTILLEEDAVRRARGLRWPKFSYYMVVSDIDSFEEIIHDMEEDEIQAVKDEILQIHKDVLWQKRHCFFIGNKSDSFHCLFTGQVDRQEIKRCMKEIHAQVQKAFSSPLTTGVSREIYRFLDFEQAYLETRTAIRIARGDGRMKVCFMDELRMEEAFYEMSQMDIFKKFVSEELQILKEHDQKHGSSYVETLRVLTENMGAKKETADALYLHRNTLAYRIRQIEQLTGYDLNDPEVIFRLQLAIKVNRYMKS